jgi:fatty acid desaturase
MLKVIGILLVLWIALSIVGAVIEGLFWLTVVGLVLLVGTAVYGFLKHRQGHQPLR